MSKGILGRDSVLTEKGVRGVFLSGFMTRARRNRYEEFTQVIDSHVEEEKYGIVGRVPQLKETLTEADLEGFEEYEYRVKQRKFKSAVPIQRDFFDYDQTGKSRNLVAEMGARVAGFPNKLAFDRLGFGEDATAPGPNGTLIDNNCYDGKPFFATNHALSKGQSQSNIVLVPPALQIDFASDTANAVVEKLQEQIRLAENRASDFIDSHGQPWFDDGMIGEDWIAVCATDLRVPFLKATRADVIDQTTNVLKDIVANVIATNNQKIKSEPLNWYYLYVGGPVRPIIQQRFRLIQDSEIEDKILELPEQDRGPAMALGAVEIQTVMNTGQNISFQTFIKDEFYIGTRMKTRMAYGLWQYAIKLKSVPA